MKIRWKVYKWLVVSMILSLSLTLAYMGSFSVGDAISELIKISIQMVVAILFLEYGIFLRILRVSKFTQRKKGDNSFEIKDYGHDELSDIISHINDQSEMITALTDKIQVYEDRMEALINDSPLLMQSFDRNGKIKFINEAYAEHFGVDSEEMVGQNIFDFISEKGYNFDLRKDLKKLTKDHPTNSNTYRRKSQRGWLLWINRAIFDNYGQAVEYQTVGVDVTKQKELEGKLTFFYDFVATITSVDLCDIRDILKNLVTNIAGFLRADKVRIFLFDEDAVRLAVGETFGKESFDVHYPGVSSPEWWKEQFDKSKDGFYLIRNIGDLRTEEAKHALHFENIKSAIVVPVAYNHTYIGVMTVEAGHDSLTEFEKFDAVTARTLARIIGTVLRTKVTKLENGKIMIDKDII